MEETRYSRNMKRRHLADVGSTAGFAEVVVSKATPGHEHVCEGKRVVMGRMGREPGLESLTGWVSGQWQGEPWEGSHQGVGHARTCLVLKLTVASLRKTGLTGKAGSRQKRWL